MISHYKSIPLEKAIPYLPSFLDIIHRYCVDHYQNPDYSQTLRDKFHRIETGHIKGHLILNNQDEPKGMSWMEIVCRNYGNCIMVSMGNEWEQPVVETFIQSELANSKLLELYLFSDSSTFRSTLTQLGVIENYRQRMAIFLQDITFESFGTSFQLLPLSKLDPKDICQLSVDAHKVSQDYKGYYDLVELSSRCQLEDDVRSGVYGPYNWDASYGLVSNDQLLGFCSYVDIESWGEKKVPWLFDMCVHPDFHGLGYGRGLLHHSLNILKDQHLKFAGLAVTNDNHSALGLYQSIGFSFVEHFYEYAF